MERQIEKLDENILQTSIHFLRLTHIELLYTVTSIIKETPGQLP